MSTTPATATNPPTAVHPLKVRDFRLLWIGSTISLLGDQFYLVALPWLVLQVTGSGLALGTILMVAATPRAVFMLIGGAASDRFSPRRVLISTTSGRSLLVAAIAALIYLHRISLWHLYALAFAFGFADAFSLPAAQALLPSVVSDNQLPAANALMSGSAQASTIAGPAPAGIAAKHWGTASTFLVDAVSFLFVIAALVRLPENPVAIPRKQQTKGIWHDIVEGLHYVTSDAPIRSLMLLVAALNFGAAGPLVVGLATMAKQRFASAASFGTMLSSLAAGALIGTLLPAVVKHQQRRGPILLVFCAGVGVGMAVIGVLHRVVLIAPILAAMGLGSGFVNVNLQAWLQTRVERAMLGRVLSVLMFAGVGLIPFSYALAGALAQINLAAIFIGAGALVILLTGVAATNQTVRAID